MKLLFSPKHREDELVWGDTLKKVKYLTKKWKKKILFPQNANFLITDEQELI